MTPFYKVSVIVVVARGEMRKKWNVDEWEHCRDINRCMPQGDLRSDSIQDVVEIILPISRKRGSSSLGIASFAALFRMSACSVRTFASLL